MVLPSYLRCVEAEVLTRGFVVKVTAYGKITSNKCTGSSIAYIDDDFDKIVITRVTDVYLSKKKPGIYNFN